MSGIDSDLIRGHIDTIILKTLFDGDKYGYEILDEVAKKSGGAYELKQPTLYSCLKRLENQGLISSYWVDSEIGGKRHYYCLTDNGKETYIQNQKDWLRSRQIIDNLIWEDAPHLPDREITTEQSIQDVSVDNDLPAEENIAESSVSIEEKINNESATENTPNKPPVITENVADTTDEKLEIVAENDLFVTQLENTDSSEQNNVDISDNSSSDDTTDIMQLLGHFDFQNSSKIVARKI